MLLLFSVFLIVAGKVGVDFIISDIFKACVLELGFIGEGVAAVALILGVHAGEVERIHRVFVFLELDLVAVAVEDLNIEAQGLEFLDKDLERLGHAGLRDVVALDDGLVGAHTAGHVVGLDRQDLLQGVSRAVGLEGPNFHFAEALAAELRLAAERLLRDKGVRAGGTGVDLIVDQMVQLEEVNVTDGDLVVETLTGTAVVQPALALGIEASLDQLLLDLVVARTVENRRCDLVAEGLGGIAQMNFEHLTDVHTGRNAQGVQHDVERRTVGQEGHILLRKDAGNNALYQIPVIKIKDLDYGTYTVVIKVAYSAFQDVADKKQYSFWLDAVRVYDPMGTNNSDTYAPDGEAKPVFVEVRDMLLSASSVAENNTNNGVVFIDGNGSAAIATDYKNFGPNHEVYLANNQAIAFRIADATKYADIQIGIKSTGNSVVKYKINNDTEATIGTATDMYYSVKDYASNGSVVTIINTGETVLSITNIKCTMGTSSAKTDTVDLVMSAEDVAVAISMVNSAITPVEPEPEPEPEKTFEPDRFEASWSRNVMQGRKATLTVKTSEDVEAITVDGQTIRSYRTRTERVGFGRRAKRITYREFTYSMVAQESADFSVTAINAEGIESEAITARLTVKTRPNSMRDMWDWFKGWF